MSICCFFSALIDSGLGDLLATQDHQIESNGGFLVCNDVAERFEYGSPLKFAL